MLSITAIFRKHYDLVYNCSAAIAVFPTVMYMFVSHLTVSSLTLTHLDLINLIPIYASHGPDPTENHALGCL